MATTSKFDFGLINDQIKTHSDQIVNLQNATAYIVNGDTAPTSLPVSTYAYIKNNTHGLSEGLYKVKGSAFPATGGTADATAFEAVSGGGLNAINYSLSNLIKTASVTGTTSGTGSLLAGVSYRKVIVAKVDDPMDVMVIPVISNYGTNYFKILNWDMTPVANTSVTVTYWYVD